MQVGARRLVIFFLSVAPSLWLLQTVIRLQRGEWDLLGPEPGKAIVWFCGSWAFNFLLLTLAVTPLRRLLGWRWLQPHRRMLGLFVFFYATLHLLAYFAFLLEWNWQELAGETIKRPYLLLGMLAWILLIPLAVTSTRRWQRRLGRKWVRLHRLVYGVALLVSVHYLLQIRASWFEPVLYSGIALLLLLLRQSGSGSRKKFS